MNSHLSIEGFVINGNYAKIVKRLKRKNLLDSSSYGAKAKSKGNARRPPVNKKACIFSRMRNISN